METIKNFLSCDWGTSTFRLCVVEVPELKIIAEQNTSDGIAACFELWKQQGKDENTRLSFYLDVLRRHIITLEKRLNISLTDIPLIISGMASSSMGMTELAYKELPFSVDGSDLITKIIEPGTDFPNRLLIISGAKTDTDAMRGEETQLAGCFSIDTDISDGLFIFPGTHSKHIEVKKGKAISIKTYMTGEFFELLSKKSILSGSVEQGDSLNDESFEKAVHDSLQLNLLHSSFLVRTNDLFHKCTKQQNYNYLSALLIATELKELMKSDYSAVTLVGQGRLVSSYKKVFGVLNKGKHVLKNLSAQRVIVQGQAKFLSRIQRKIENKM